jgi:hypothetical protein
MTQIPFKNIEIGQKLRFPGHPYATVYTRVETRKDPDGDADLDRTLQYEMNGEVRDAFCREDSETLVELIDADPT